MKKATPTQPQVETKSDVGHLDVTLTQITTRTVDRLEKWWKPLIGILVAAFVVYLIYHAVSVWRGSEDAALNERLFRLFHSTAARKDDYKLDTAAVRSLLADVQGSALEPMVYQAAAGHYLDRADRLEAEVKEAERKAGDTGATPPAGDAAAGGNPTGALAQEIEAARAEALTFAGEAAQKLPADARIVEWAARVKATIEAERKQDWGPSKWKFTPPPPAPGAAPTASPPAAEDAPAASPPAGEAAPAPASSDAVK